MQWNNNRQAILCVDLIAQGVACFCVQSGLLSPQKNGIMRITNIFKNRDDNTLNTGKRIRCL